MDDGTLHVEASAGHGPGSGLHPVDVRGTGPASLAGASSGLTDGGGPVLTLVQVIIIFWGRYWARADASPSASQITTAVETILGSPYMSELAQYRNVMNGKLYGTTTVSSSDPPQNFTNTQVGNLVTSCIQAGALPKPGNLANVYYAVVLPPNVAYETAGIYGYHWGLTVDGHLGAVGWSGNNGVLDNITHAFSHELVEACSDPNSDAFLINGQEIGDVCEGVPAAKVHGVAVTTYWSDRLQTCIAPTGPEADELWRSRWTGGWSNFAPFTIGGQPHYLGYKSVGGYATVDRVNPGGQDVSTLWTGALATGFTSLIPIPLADGPYALGHNAASHDTEIYKIHPDGHGVDLSWKTTWGSGYAVMMPFATASLAYYLAYNTANGGVSIDRVNPGGQDVTTTYYGTWTLGWTHFAPFSLGGQPAYLGYKSAAGYATVDQVRADASGVDTLWVGGMLSGFTSIDPFTLGSLQYFLCYNARTGHVRIYRLRPGNGGLELSWQGYWTTGWTSFVPFQLGGKSAHLVYKTTDGTVAIDEYNS
jgi:hypothetical protein